MNRLRELCIVPGETPPARLVRGFSRTVAREPACAIFTPLHYESNYAYPLVVWLHGVGQNEHSLGEIMPRINLRNYVAVAPRGTGCLDEETDGRRYVWRDTEDHIFLAQERILHAIEVAQSRLNVDVERIFLAGEGCGGTVALRMAMQYPERFAGVVSLGGAFPRGSAPLARIGDARNMPLFVATARQSRTYRSQTVCEDLRLYYTAGMTSVTLKEYPGTTQMSEAILGDVNRWIMETIAGDPAASVISDVSDDFA